MWATKLGRNLNIMQGPTLFKYPLQADHEYWSHIGFYVHLSPTPGFL